MAIGPGLMVAGTAMQIVSGWASNVAEAEAQRQNAEFYGEQAAFAAISSIRAKALAGAEYSKVLGNQISSYAKGGVDISGSAEITVGGTVKEALDEIRALDLKGKLDTKLAALRMRQAANVADIKSSPGYNLMQSAAIGATNTAKYLDK